MNEQIIKKIKSRGYWRINFRPLAYNKEEITLLECKDFVEKNRVQQRGWSFPYVPSDSSRNGKLFPGNNYYNAWINWDYNKEYWRMYQSSQFIAYLALSEDWMDESSFSVAPYQPLKYGENLEVLRTLYQVTEIFEFLSRLVRNGLYGDGLELDLSLNNTMERTLCIMDPTTRRVPLYDQYTSNTNNIEMVKIYQTSDSLIKPRELAMETLSFLFERFSWHNFNPSTFKSDQERLYP